MDESMQEPIAAPAEAAKKQEYILPASIVIAAVMISGSLLYTASDSRRPAPAAPGLPAAEEPAAASGEAPAVGGRDAILGEEGAPVTIIEYGDYQCPFCARFFRDTEPKIREQYVKTGKARMVYRNFAFLSDESFRAAEAAECAKDQGKFWAFHDAVFAAELKDGTEHNGNLDRALFLSIAEEIGADEKKFTECVDARTYADAVLQETADAKKYGVEGTPATFVNAELVSGAQPFGSFDALIKRSLGK